MAIKDQHVIPYNGKWAVRPEGSEQITSVYDTKQEAIDAAFYIARTQGATIYIHGRNGQLLLGSEAPSKIGDDRIREAVRAGIPLMMRKASKKRNKKSSARSQRKS